MNWDFDEFMDEIATIYRNILLDINLAQRGITTIKEYTANDYVKRECDSKWMNLEREYETSSIEMNEILESQPPVRVGLLFFVVDIDKALNALKECYGLVKHYKVYDFTSLEKEIEQIINWLERDAKYTPEYIKELIGYPDAETIPRYVIVDYSGIKKVEW